MNTVSKWKASPRAQYPQTPGMTKIMIGVAGYQAVYEYMVKDPKYRLR